MGGGRGGGSSSALAAAIVTEMRDMAWQGSFISCLRPELSSHQHIIIIAVAESFDLFVVDDSLL